MFFTSEHNQHVWYLHQAVLPYFLSFLSSTVIQSQLSVMCNTTKTKRYQQEIPTYLQFRERCKIYIFLVDVICE